MTGKRVAITGASGLIGSALTATLAARGDDVIRLVRRPPESSAEARWSPERGLESPGTLERIDAVVHLAGESIAASRWTASRKLRLRDSRILATDRLTRSLAGLSHPPATFVMASGIGIYGDRGDEVLTESSEPGTGFLAELAREWEAAAAPARERGLRVVVLRMGLVLSPRGGLLQRLLLPFRLGVGGPVGRRNAWWSWVALDDVIGLLLHAIDRREVTGAYNVVAPGAVTGAAFTRALGRALHRPALLPVPPAMLRLVFGEMADEAILASTHVEPRRALESGYAFDFPELDLALAHLLGPRARAASGVDRARGRDA